MPGNILVAILAHNYPFKANKTLQSRDKVPTIILLQSTSAVYGICLPDKQFKKCKLPNRWVTYRTAFSITKDTFVNEKNSASVAVL
jgi:hypothetical protein